MHDNLHRETHKPYGPPISASSLQLWRNQANTDISTIQTAENTLIYAHKIMRILEICDINLGSMIPPAPEGRDFVE